MKLIGRAELVGHPDYATPEARLPHLDECFAMVEEWTQHHTKYEAMQLLNEVNVPCGPVLDMRELLEDESLAARGMMVEVEHPQRGTFKTVGCPLQLSDSPVEVKTSPGSASIPKKSSGSWSATATRILRRPRPKARSEAGQFLSAIDAACASRRPRLPQARNRGLGGIRRRIETDPVA